MIVHAILLHAATSLCFFELYMYDLYIIGFYYICMLRKVTGLCNWSVRQVALAEAPKSLKVAKARAAFGSCRNFLYCFATPGTKKCSSRNSGNVSNFWQARLCHSLESGVPELPRHGRSELDNWIDLNCSVTLHPHFLFMFFYVENCQALRRVQVRAKAGYKCLTRSLGPNPKSPLLHSGSKPFMWAHVLLFFVTQVCSTAMCCQNRI